MENSLDAFLSSQLLTGSLLACPLYGLLYILTVPFNCGAEAAEPQAQFLPEPATPGGTTLSLALCLPTKFQCFRARGQG